MNPERQRLIDEMFRQPQVAELAPPDGAGEIVKAEEYEAESARIAENKKKWGQTSHRFMAAEWTHPNGHPRCIRCGMEESTDGLCMPELEKYALQLDEWVNKFTAEFTRVVDGKMETTPMPTWIERYHAECIEKNAGCDAPWPLCPVEKAWSDEAREAAAEARRNNARARSRDEGGPSADAPPQVAKPKPKTDPMDLGDRDVLGDDPKPATDPLDDEGYKPKPRRRIDPLDDDEYSRKAAVEKYIREEDGKFNVYSEAGKLLGSHATHAEAVAQLRAIEVNKHGDHDQSTHGNKEGGPDASVDPKAPKASKPKPPSKAADDELGYNGWQHQGDGVYTNPNMPGHEITVGAQGTGGTAHSGRNIVSYTSWSHKTPDGKVRQDRGVQSLGYHLQQEGLRAGVKNPKPKEVDDEGYQQAQMDSAEAAMQDAIRAKDRDAYDRARAAHVVAQQRRDDAREMRRRATKALQAAFMKFADARGIVVKREEVMCTPIERTDAGDVYKIEYGVGKAYFMEKAGAVQHLEHYVQRQAAMHPIAKAEEQRYTLGAVYAPGEVDYHGDTMTEAELEKSAWAYAQKDGLTSRVGLMHQSGTNGAGKVVESYIYRGPVWKLKDASGNEQTIVPGTWMLGVVWEPEAWERIKRNELTGYSLQGIARKFDMEGKEI